MNTTKTFKKPYFIFALIAFSALACILFIPKSIEASETVQSEKKVYSAHADYPVVNTVNELEEHADLIVSGKYTGNRSAYFQTDDQGEVVVRASKSEFQIEQIYKGNQPDSVITVAEPAYEDEEAIYTIEGYNLMNTFDNYVLFLGATETGAYRIIGMYQGQYQIDSDLNTQSLTSNSIETVHFEDEQKDHYSLLKEQVLDFLVEESNQSDIITE
ncbi:hypothetical protein JNUCC31_13630 [Paenibacillus sp. JNUCC31]|uniref:hypothetical protein n=1 Tax=Paenibacillus sp. JNUCC-31 TaxID=2777983 RepID=UPI00177B7042|nr:hypothetical protein [Paenibacillus sp. JNUCC-31]QOS81787.1 hypothetical protein JNUCC31_13630 [Paenibacillus sp. JNUCC-31]